MLTVYNAGDSRKALFEELCHAIEPHHSQLTIEDKTCKGESLFIKRRITTALRWYSIKEKLGWATSVLGDVMSSQWFKCRILRCEMGDSPDGTCTFCGRHAGAGNAYAGEKDGRRRTYKAPRKLTTLRFRTMGRCFHIQREGMGSRPVPQNCGLDCCKDCNKMVCGCASCISLRETVIDYCFCAMTKRGKDRDERVGTICLGCLAPGCDPQSVTPLDQIISALIPGLGSKGGPVLH